MGLNQPSWRHKWNPLLRLAEATRAMRPNHARVSLGSSSRNVATRFFERRAIQWREHSSGVWEKSRRLLHPRFLHLPPQGFPPPPPPPPRSAAEPPRGPPSIK